MALSKFHAIKDDKMLGNVSYSPSKKKKEKHPSNVNQ